VPESQLPLLPGFVVLGPDPWGDDRDRFDGIEEGTRRRVALRVIPALYPQERTAVTAVLDRYAQVRHEHLAAPVRLGEQTDVLVVPGGEHSTLARLQPPVTTPGQVVTALAPVAQALAALHAAGLAHGEVGADVVAVDADGRPTLLGAGVRAALHEIAPREIPDADADADVSALLALAQQQAAACTDDAAPLHAALADLAGGPVSAAVVAERLLTLTPAPLGEPEPEPGAEPEPELGAEPEPVAEPEPEAVAEPEPEPVAAMERQVEPGTGLESHPDEVDESRLRGRPWLVGVLPLLAVLLLVALAVRWASSDESTPVVSAGPSATASVGPSLSPQATEQPSPVAEDGDTSAAAAIELCGAPPPAAEQAPPLPDDWADVVRELYTTRSAALVTGQTSLLCDVFDPGSPGLASDLELAAAFERQQVRPDQLTWVVDEVTLDAEQGALVTLTITDELEPYSLVNDEGRVVAELPGIDQATWQARLVPDASGEQWRFG
jgi:outer membrane biosynthesis protein TonB